VLPFIKDGTGRAGQYIGLGSSGTIALKKASPDRIEELLGILNYVCAPMGSTEALLMQYGVEGTDFTRDANGNPVLTDQGKSDTVVPWKNIGGPPEFLLSSTSSEIVPYTYQAQKEHFAVTVPNPIAGLYSPTDGSKGIVLRTAFLDGLSDILFGRAPISGYADLVQNWRSNGGDTIRSEYEKAFQQAKA
jgi:putative aldouronate transport system substrate-binding protein